MTDPARLVARLMLRTEHGPLRPLWRLLYGMLVELSVRYLRGGRGDESVFARGSFGAQEPVYGLSDVDLVVVVAGDDGASGSARERVEGRWRRLCRIAPIASRLLAVKVYEETELLDAADATVLTHGLRPSRKVARARARLNREGRAADAVFFGGHPLNRHYRIRTRPGLDRPMRDWRCLAGPDRRPDVRSFEGPERVVAAWLELQCWWLYAAWACCHPGDRQVPYICLKLVAEAARIWVWLVHGEWAPTRTRALERGLALMPADEPVLRLALGLRRRVTPPDPDWLPQVLGWYVDFSTRLAELASREPDGPSATVVQLAWSPPTRTRSPAASRTSSPPVLSELPLVDWRSLVMSDEPDEALSLCALDPKDPAAVRAAAAEESRGRCVAMRAPGVLVMPAADLRSRPFPRGTLRAVQCEASDPVSFALVHGRSAATFPGIPGWSAQDYARRAVAENRARLATARSLETSSALGLLFCAARAGLFLESLAEGEPRLPLTSADVSAALAHRREQHEPVATSAREAIEDLRLNGEPPPAGIVAEFGRITRALPAFRDG